MGDTTDRRVYQTGASFPKFYHLFKIHKKDMHLRPIVLSRGSVTYGAAKELGRILQPLIGKAPYCIQNSQEFVQLSRTSHYEQENATPPMILQHSLLQS